VWGVGFLMGKLPSKLRGAVAANANYQGGFTLSVFGERLAHM